MKSRHDVQAALARHIGRDNGIAAAVLARELDIEERQVRSYISELRAEGTAVCGHPKTGYFIAANDEELLETCEFLYARAMHSLRLISVLHNVPLPELRGQLRLPT